MSSLKSLSLCGKYFLFIFAYLFIGLVFNGGWIFTEWGFFTEFFRSMLTDLDFNIINQVEPDKAWLVTKNYFHPSIHPESQMGLMFPLYIFEYLTSLMVTMRREPAFEYALTGFLMNIFSIGVGFFFNKKSAEILKIKFGILEMGIFYFGCPLLFFSTFQVNVVEVMAFPLLSYLVFVCLSYKVGSHPKSVFTSAVVVGFLFITKITFWPVASFTAAVVTWHALKERKWSKALSFWFIVGLLIAANSLNMWVKYGYPSNLGPPWELFADFSLSNISTNLLYGFFPKGGLFFANPIYAFSSLGILLFLLNSYKKNFLNVYEILFFLGWFVFCFFHQAIIMGYIVEDHLPGRIHLGVAPLLVLGMAYLKEMVSLKFRKTANVTLIVLSVWHIIITFFYLNIIQMGSFIYVNNVIPNPEVFSEAFQRYSYFVRGNYDKFLRHWPHIIFFSLLVSLFVTVLQKSLFHSDLIKKFAMICMISFIGMSLCNLFFHEKNILALKAGNFFAGKAVGKGKELYAIDYILDSAKTIASRNNPIVNEKLKVILDAYYGKVQKQVIVSTPELDQAIKERSADFSFSITTEYQKGPITEQH